jgi:hypothetical protein
MTTVRSCLATLAAAAGLAATSPILAQTYLPCDGVRQDRNACLREQAAAAQAERRGELPATDPGQLRRNALARCDRQPVRDRAECQARVLGTGRTTIDGSVLGGGLIRSTVTTIPAR